MPTHESWLRLALREARRGVGRTSPNPAVGAVIVSPKGKLLSKGWHRAAGSPHAEIEALRHLPRPGRAHGATLYVTLEPCSTHGRTPPCVDAIIAAGIARVVVAAIDPNPKHSGRGLDQLRAAGIEVISGILASEAAALNRAFNKWIVTGLPLVIAKCALSLDGRIARPASQGRWLTGELARLDAHRLRAQVDAIIIGAGTLRADNPRLTIRGVRHSRQPWRVVLTRTGNLPAHSHLFTDEHRDRTLIFKNRPLKAVLRALARRGVTTVMIEGGAQILAEAFDRRLADRVHFYIAPILLGGPDLPLVRRRNSGLRSPTIENPKYRAIGPDLLVTGDVNYYDGK
jgi:diaminohydroxyphosphoribosylaminopyrimidine deaminase/5-amino-6-(5-phosphoribosylamino)uracil reductase